MRANGIGQFAPSDEDAMIAVAGYDGLKVVSVTTPARRARLSEELTAWLQTHADRRPVHVIVRQSSDRRHHCISILIFWRSQKRCRRLKAE